MNESAEPIFNRTIALIVRHTKLLLLMSFVGAVVCVGISYLKTPVFKADATLVPSDEMLGLDQNSALGGLGGLATLVSGSAAGSKENEAIAILKSRALIYSYVQANTLLPILFSDRWDPAANGWKSQKPSSIPTLEDAYNLFDNNIRTVVENRKTGLITLTVTWKDPMLAKQWVDGLVRTTNDILRNQAIARSERNLAYLGTAAEKTSVMEVKATISKLIEAEIKKQMTAVGSIDYAFRIVDPAIVPGHKSAPKRSIYAAFGMILGGLTCLLVLSFKAQMNSRAL
jgi:uncharacterized protein involved in exopolysaccharide biosynthesis